MLCGCASVYCALIEKWNDLAANVLAVQKNCRYPI